MINIFMWVNMGTNSLEAANSTSSPY